MQNCKKCVHYELCLQNSIAYGFKLKGCSKFKNKADFQEVKHSKWVKVKVDLGEGITTYRAACLHCGFQKNTFIGNYCPNCGAIMDCKNEIKYVDELNGENSSE